MAGVTKYTKEVLEPIVSSSNTYAEVIRKLGLRQTGGTQRNIKQRCIDYGISVEHFVNYKMSLELSRGWNKKGAEYVLVKRNPLSPRVRAKNLRKALDEIGVPRICVECGLGEEWNGKPLRLEIDHIDSKFENNTRENLRYLCPNCHSQTETYGNKSKKRVCGEIGNTQ